MASFENKPRIIVDRVIFRHQHAKSSSVDMKAMNAFISKSLRNQLTKEVENGFISVTNKRTTLQNALNKENVPITNRQEFLKPARPKQFKRKDVSIRRMRPAASKTLSILIPSSSTNVIKVPLNSFYSKIEKIDEEFNAFLEYRSKMKATDDFSVINV